MQTHRDTRRSRLGRRARTSTGSAPRGSASGGATTPSDSATSSSSTGRRSPKRRLESRLGVAERVAWPKADGAPHREEQYDECERDRAQEGDQEVPGREGDRNPHVDDLPEKPDEQAVECVAEGEAVQPSGEGEGDFFFSEGAAGSP